MKWRFWEKERPVTEFRTVYALHKVPTDTTDGVSVTPLGGEFLYTDNQVKTYKYEIWNFVFKNLFEQFRRIANFYFLAIVIVQFAIQDKSPVSPTTSLTPLLFVVIVTAIKQAYEDYRRHVADREVNNRLYMILNAGTFQPCKSMDIKVGDIVMVKQDEEFPCDLVQISSFFSEGHCYITTANLDGETNLKLRQSVPGTVFMQESDALDGLSATVECDHPEFDMYKYNGRFTLYQSSGMQVYALSPQNLLLRGARLKNTSFIVGLAVYTGADTKMALNSQNKTIKNSSLEKKMNSFLVFFLCLLLVTSSLSTMIRFLNKWSGMPSVSTTFAEVIVELLSFLTLFNYIIPISMYVTLELQKFVGAMFFTWDLELYHESTDDPAKANTSDLIEELGQIEYVFSDKTGTLTENDMQFRMCSINGTKYSVQDGLLSEESSSKPLALTEMTDDVKLFFMALALCHTVEAEPSKESGPFGLQYDYMASSPDEKAFVEIAARIGITFVGKKAGFMEVMIDGQVHRYKVLHVLEFDSTRKRMSIILKTPWDEIVMYCKGAESHVFPNVLKGPRDITQDHINEYATLGLRTLAISVKKLSLDEFVSINLKLAEAQQSIVNHDQRIAEAYDAVEQDLVLLGATAVEDRLQNGVKETIESLRLAGIKFWVLTGDKLETAVNISFSCGHLTSNMDIIYVANITDKDKIDPTLKEGLSRIEKSRRSFALVIDGFTLATVLVRFRDDFIQLTSACSAVLCCRMSPLQKAQVVKVMKESSNKPITLAIGDGANDCSMIQEAHVGCGVMGKEGRQAVRCADYAFHRFHYLRRVLLVHGFNFYQRLSTVVIYFFYKNVAMVVPVFLFQCFSLFSAQPFYDGVLLTVYNIFLTSGQILFYGMFEQKQSACILERSPQLYRSLTRNNLMSWRNFFLWLLAGLWHGIVAFFCTYILFGNSCISKSQQPADLFMAGFFCYSSVVVLVNLKLCLLTRYWTWLTHLAVWGTLIFMMALFCFIFGVRMEGAGVVSSLDLYWVFYDLYALPSAWLGFFLVLMVSLFPDIVVIVLQKHFGSSVGTSKPGLYPTGFTMVQLSNEDHGSHGDCSAATDVL